MENQKAFNINTIGIGIFLWISIISFSYLISLILEKMLMINAIPFEISFWIYNGVSFLFYCVITFIALNYLSKLKAINYSNMYLILIVAVFVLQLLHILIQYFGSNLLDHFYSEEISKYYEFQSNYISLYSYQYIFEFLKYVYLGIILLILNNSK